MHQHGLACLLVATAAWARGTAADDATMSFLAAMSADLGAGAAPGAAATPGRNRAAGGKISFSDVREPEAVVIIGQGPAGLSAAIYASRANLRPLVIARDAGQLSHPGAVENFPGCTWDASGSDIMASFLKQAKSFGTRFLEADVEHVHLRGHPYWLRLRSGHVVRFKALVVASGATSRWLHVPGENKYFTKGVASCATCDGWFYRNKAVAVIGGGDTAMETALFMSRIARSVTVIHRSSAFRASKIMAERVLQHKGIEVMWDTKVLEFEGDGQKLTRLSLEHGPSASSGNASSGAARSNSKLSVDGAFVVIGHSPNTEMFEKAEHPQLLDAQGYLRTVVGSATATSIEGVFAAGDVADHLYRQAITSAGTGAMAALDVERHLCHLGC